MLQGSLCRLSPRGKQPVHPLADLGPDLPWIARLGLPSMVTVIIPAIEPTPTPAVPIPSSVNAMTAVSVSCAFKSKEANTIIGTLQTRRTGLRGLNSRAKKPKPTTTPARLAPKNIHMSAPCSKSQQRACQTDIGCEYLNLPFASSFRTWPIASVGGTSLHVGSRGADRKFATGASSAACDKADLGSVAVQSGPSN
jgi:hypothetical protein